MRRSWRFRLILVLAVFVGIFAVNYAVSAKRTAKYVGSKTCIECHEGTHESITKAYAKTLHAAALADAVKNPKSIVAVFGADAPFKKTQVKYVMGKGVRYQHYLDAGLKLLPAKWDSVGKKWEKIEEPADAVTQCVGCHVTNFDPDTKSWSEMGVGCEACHGPGAAHADSMEAKDIVNIKKLDAKKREMICGQCHAVGTDTAGKCAFSTTYVPGDDLAASFTLKPADKGQPNNQYNEFIESKHFKSNLKCTTCHSAHGDKSKAAHQVKLPYNDLCLGCHKSDFGDTKGVVSMKAHAPNAKPTDTCATCHMVNGSHKFTEPASL